MSPGVTTGLLKTRIPDLDVTWRDDSNMAW
jgi:hypothetical protein